MFENGYKMIGPAYRYTGRMTTIAGKLQEREDNTSTRGGLNPCKRYADGRQKRRLQKAKNGGRK